MSGSNPKYLPIPKKIPYNIRMPKPLLDKLNAYAELTGNTTTDIVISALNNFINNKTVYNSYLPNIKGITIEIPVLAHQKMDFYNSNIIGENPADEMYNELSGYPATTEAFEVLKIPNNTDSFNAEFGFTTPVGNVIGKGKHSGIEFVILPDVYTYYDNDDVFDALYCFYFDVEMDKLKSVKLIDYIDAINKANDVGNLTLKNNLTKCVGELKQLNQDLENYDGYDDVEILNYIMDGLKNIAATYNTGNIIPLGENIDDDIVAAKIKQNPEYITGIIDDKIETIVGDRLEAIINEKVDEIFDEKMDELKTATGNMNDKLDEIDKMIKSYLK